MVRPSGFEPPTFCSGGKRSIQLSYGRTEMPQLYRNRAADGWLHLRRFDGPCVYWPGLLESRFTPVTMIKGGLLWDSTCLKPARVTYSSSSAAVEYLVI